MPVTSTQATTIEESRARRTEVDQVLRELGGDAEALLRVNRSVAAGLNEAAIEIDASLLLLGWPGPDDLRAWMVGATHSEIVAATSVPVAIAALHPDASRGRVVVSLDADELVPGNLPTVTLALELATSLARAPGEPLVLGPMAPSTLETAGLTVPTTVDHRDGERALEEWAAAVTHPGDLLVMPILDTAIQPAAVRCTDRGGPWWPSSRTPRPRPQRWSRR